MTGFGRRLRGLLGAGLTWALGWAIVTAITGFVIGILDRDSIDPGESVLGMSALVGLVGFISGVGFGLLLSLLERRKSIHDLSLGRVAMWGVMGAAGLPLLTPMNNALLIVLCPLGASFAAASLAIARRGALRGAEPVTGLSTPPRAK